jgi:hypothetical protein
MIRKLTLLTRLKMCYEILTIRDHHQTYASEKQLSMFKSGYSYGLYDKKLKMIRSNDS